MNTNHSIEGSNRWIKENNDRTLLSTIKLVGRIATELELGWNLNWMVDIALVDGENSSGIHFS